MSYGKGGGGDTSAESYSTLFMTYQLKSLTYKGKVSFRVYIEKEIQYNTKILNPWLLNKMFYVHFFD